MSARPQEKEIRRETDLHTERSLEKCADAEAEEVEWIVFACEVRSGGGDVVGKKVVEATRR